MATAVLETPTKLRLPDEVADRVREELVYEDKSVTFEWLKYFKIQKMDNEWLLSASPKKGNRLWYFNKATRESLDSKVAELQQNRFKSLLFKDSRGYWTYSGFVTKIFGKDAVIKREYELPEWGMVPWAQKPEHELRWFQQKSLDLLVPEDRSISHGSVEIGTGLGKTLIMLYILKRIGLSAVVVVPTKSIGEQMLFDLTKAFGGSRVGKFFEGKKDSKKLFTVAVAKSLMNVEEGDEHYQNLVNKKVFICDESHQVPAESLAKLSLGLLGNVPYRFFFSGTQLRNDGLELLLNGIIGNVVFSMSVKEGVDQKFLSRPVFYQWNITSDSKYNKDDSIEMNRRHLHANKAVNAHAVKLVKAAVKAGRRVMVMIAEIEQFNYLKEAGILDLDIRIAHGGGLKTHHKEFLPKQFHKSDNMELVASFDRGEYPVLIGTSCIGMGTDIKSVSCIVDLVGLTSEIRLRQGVGRGTRLFEGKTDCVYNDYSVKNIEKLLKHSKTRKKILNGIYPPVITKEAK